MDTRQITAILKGCKVTSSVFKGVYALDFVKRCRGPGIYAINFAKNRSIGDFMSMFGGDALENDILVHDYVSSTFNIDVPLIDVNMITNQLGY